MVANMALPVKQPQHPNNTPKDGAPDHHPYANWPLKADMGCKADSSHGNLIPSLDESSNSWEARAFAEDASSLAAGIWPPRAYPCSFCRREFRSAQALGGHMNVHRRDRARLRHSSPPPSFCATHNTSLQPSSIIHKSQYAYSSTTSLETSACPDVYPNQHQLSKINLQLPNALPLSAAISPQSSTASLAARYPSDMAASFPRRLHLLASEAASTLMLPHVKPSDLLSLWPTSALDSGNGCHSSMGTSGIKGTAIDIPSWSASSSSSSSSSIILNCAVTPSVGATPCRRTRHDVPIIHLEDESPRKKSNVINNSDFQPDRVIKLKNPSNDDGISQAHDKARLDMVDNGVDDRIHLRHAWPETRSNNNEHIDLELRLGHRPP